MASSGLMYKKFSQACSIPYDASMDIKNDCLFAEYRIGHKISLGKSPSEKRKTWTKKRLIIIIVVATVYSIWFGFLDTLVYCQPQGVTNDCRGAVVINHIKFGT